MESLEHKYELVTKELSEKVNCLKKEPICIGKREDLKYSTKKNVNGTTAYLCPNLKYCKRQSRRAPKLTIKKN